MNKSVLVHICLHSAYIASRQAEAAKRCGIRAVAIHEDSLAAAKRAKPPRYLFREVVEGKWDLIVVSPEMMQEPGFTNCVLDKRVISTLGWVFVDEPHLAIDWAFRSAYNEIGKLRSRIGDSGVAWAAYTATIAPGSPLRQLKALLGYTEGHYKSIRMPVDRPEIKYIPEFFGYPHTGLDIPDIGWLIPSRAKDGTEIPQCLVRCESIKNIVRVVNYLNRLVSPTIPKDLASGLGIVMPFHSQLTEQTRTAALEGFRSGDVRILVLSDCGMVGLDLDARMIVVFDVPKSFSELVQWIGRVGRRGPATAYMYAPDWMRIEGEDELHGKDGGKVMAPTTLQNCREQRAKFEDVVVRFFNATWAMCPRRINAIHWGDIGPADTFIPPSQCCNQHQRDNSRLPEIALRVSQVKTKSVKQILPRSQGDYLPLDSDQQRDAFGTFVCWRKARWVEIRNQDMLLTDVFFLPDRLISRLCEKLHLVLDYERLRIVMAEWAAVESEGRALYQVAKSELEKFEALNQEKRAREASKKEGKCGKGRAKGRRKGDDVSQALPEPKSLNQSPAVVPQQALQDITNSSNTTNRSGRSHKASSQNASTKRRRTKSESDGSADENIPTEAREPHLSSRGRLVKPRVREY